MFTRPNDLADERVADAVVEYWDISVDEIAYLPVGFGSYHWRATAEGSHWFVTADDLAMGRRQPDEATAEPLRRLAAALSTARSLADAGLEFVVAPQLSKIGAVLERVDARYAVSVYPYVEGETYSWGHYASQRQRHAIVGLIARVHAASSAVRNTGLVEDFTIPHRDRLDEALANLDAQWRSGPFGERARSLLNRNAGHVAALVTRYDEAAAAVARERDRMVVTHGEPHRANTITTSDGPVLVDWDTALIAPPERDLWALALEAPGVLEAYETLTSVRPDRQALDLYRFRWDLGEIAIYSRDFREPHTETADTIVAWGGLQTAIESVLRLAGPD